MTGDGGIDSSKLRPPFVVSEDGRDITVYDSLGRILAHVEAIDVRDGVYRVWDSAGAEVILKAVEFRVSVDSIEPPTSDSIRQLHETLLDFLSRIRRPILPVEVDALHAFELADLVRVARQVSPGYY